jgi:hypothetical protein
MLINQGDVKNLWNVELLHSFLAAVIMKRGLLGDMMEYKSISILPVSEERTASMFEVKQKGKCAKEQDKRASMNT